MNFIFASQKYENKFGFQDSTFPSQSVIASLRSNLTITGFPLPSGLEGNLLEFLDYQNKTTNLFLKRV
jgi:hypothetical protein